MSDSSDSDAFLCPVCGKDIGDLEQLFRQLHINSCLAKKGPADQKPCKEEKCPICGKLLAHLTAKLARKHVNKCIDNQAKQNAQKRSTERCPICGANLKSMSERERRIHQQTCQDTEHTTNADVVVYPKIVEDLPTPAEWEIIPQTEPKFIHPDPEKKFEIYDIEDNPLAIFGIIHNTGELQFAHKYKFSNDPYIFEEVPDTFSIFKS